MRGRVILLSAAVVFILSSLLLPLKAGALIKPFGGRVVINFVPGVVCPGEGPITIVPAGISAPTPYAVTPGTIRHQSYTPQIGSWILGSHTVLAPLCYIPTPFGPIPVPVFPIIRFGASSPSL